MCDTNFASRSTAASIPHAMRHFPRLFLGADPTFVLRDVINAKASAGTRARSNATDETIDSGSTSVQAPRTKTGSGAVSILAAVKNLKHGNNGGRVSQAQIEGSEEDEGPAVGRILEMSAAALDSGSFALPSIRRIGGSHGLSLEIPRFFFLLDSSSIQIMDLVLPAQGPYLAPIRLGTELAGLDHRKIMVLFPRTPSVLPALENRFPYSDVTRHK
ncbi:hypothetical protein K438DRAFT_1781832 [Mycena galopus ATCC 62051]|nr:hypothetical protein K438DRAFT_1781832 [Mycena galopus ATCC 62051]